MRNQLRSAVLVAVLGLLLAVAGCAALRETFGGKAGKDSPATAFIKDPAVQGFLGPYGQIALALTTTLQNGFLATRAVHRHGQKVGRKKAATVPAALPA